MKKTIGIVCALVLTSVWASTTAMAADKISCGDGKWERKPGITGAPAGAAEQCEPGDPNQNGGVCNNTCHLDSSKRRNNGVIDYIGGSNKEGIRGEWEECDDYNLDAGDGCDKGKLEKATVYPEKTDTKALCGNGIVDVNAGERCDAGYDSNNPDTERYATVCSEDCISNRHEFKTKDGYQCTLEKKLCGDGIIDTAAGEQCDDGINNGPGKRCTSFCTLGKSNPSFEIGNTLFYPFKAENKNNKIDIAGLGSRGGPPLDPKKHVDKVSILERGRVVKIAHDPNQQYSGIIPSGQSIENGVTVSFRYHSAKPGETIFDDDQVGLVFGIKPSDIEGTDEEAKEANYIMLSWRDNLFANVISGKAKANIQPSRCGTEVEQDPQGLRVYHITGRPEYNELWQRKDCGGPGQDVHITEIVTDKRTDINNNRINPAYSMTPYYTWDLGIIPSTLSAWRSYVVQQIKAIYSVSGLQVYLNGQLAIDIDGSKIENWPKTGEWGFYFLGMDNLIADFRDMGTRLINKDNNQLFINNEFNNIIPQEDAVGTRCGYCGDGILQSAASLPGKQGPETCDDGGTSDGDGCSTSCTIETGWACDTTKSPSVCYTGEITEPVNGGTVATTNPTITGTFKGSPTSIKVVIKDDTSQTACQGSATIDTAKGTWSFDTSQCTPNRITSNKAYKVHAAFKGSTGSKEHKTPETKFTVNTSAPTVEITEPKEAYNSTKSTTKLKGTHGGNSNGLEIKYSVVRLEPKPETNITSDKQATLPDSSTWEATENFPTDEGKYEVTVSATNDATTTPVQKKKIIYIDNTEPTGLVVQGEHGNELVNGGELPTNQGSAVIKGKIDQENDGASPVKVKITITDTKTNKTSTKEVDVNPDGSYTANVPLPYGTKDGDTVKVDVIAEDLAGNQSDPKSYTTLTASESAIAVPTTPGIVITSPESEGVVPGGNLKIKGRSTPGKFDSFKVYYCVANTNCTGTNKKEIPSSGINRDESTGEWTATILDTNLTDGERYKLLVEAEFNQKTEEKEITFGVQKRNLDDVTLEFTHPTEGDRNLNINTSDGTITVKVKVKDNGDKVKAGDSAHVTLRNADGSSREEICKIKDPDKSCEVTFDLTEAPIGDQVSLSSEIKLANGKTSKKAELENVAIGPKIAITSPAASGTSSTEPPTVIGGTSSGLDSSTTPIIVLCKLENDGSCTKENEIVLKGEDLEVDDQGNWTVKPSAIEKHKDKLKQPGEYTVTTYIEVGTTSPKQRVMRDQTTYTVVEPATPTNPQQPSTPTIKCVKETPNCTLAQTNDGKIIVELEGGTPNETFTVEIEDSNGNKITKTGSYDTNGKFRGEYEPKADNGNDMKAPYTITLKDSSGSEVNKKTGVTLTDSTEEVLGSIAGGCGCASTTPTEGILSLLLAALGLGFIRRRRK